MHQLSLLVTTEVSQGRCRDRSAPDQLTSRRADIGIDLYNLFNGNTATGYDQGFGTDGSTWLRPTAVLNPRFLRFNVTFDF